MTVSDKEILEDGLAKLSNKHSIRIPCGIHYHNGFKSIMFVTIGDWEQWRISSKGSLPDCLKKLNEELTYWKQHGVNPNV